MRAVMINTCQMIICLFAVSNAKPTMSVIGGYVNKGGIAYIACSIGTNITGSVAIARNGALAFNCPIPNVCGNQGLSTDYTVTQNVSSGTTTVIIQNADKNRDGVNWTCSYNAGNASDPVILTVVSPATSKRMIEGPDKITIELICTYPTNLLSFIIYLGGVIYSEATPSRTVYQACTPNYEASVNYTLTFPPKHSQSYNGIFSVYINNGFYNETLVGSTIYTFIGGGFDHCPVELRIAVGIGLAIIIIGFIIWIVLFVVKGDQFCLGLGICSVIKIIGCIISIVFLALKGYQLSLGLGICFGIIILACIICIIILVFVKNGDCLRLGHCICFVIIIIVCISCIVILAKIGGECPQSFLVGLGIGFGILIIVCIISILILVFFKKVIIQNKDTSPSPRTNEKEVTITAIIYGLWISVEWIKEKTILESNGDYTIEPYDNKTRKSSLIIKRSSMTNSATYICRAKNRCGCCSAEDSITLPYDKDKPTTGSSDDVSRQDVELQVVGTGVNSNDKERPPAFHTGTQNKVESKTTSKQTNDRHQPLPSVDTGLEDTPHIRPQPPPPQDSDIKARTRRGISATIEDAQGLPTETPRPSKLPPLPQKQPTVEEEDASEEPKKKRKKKKKKVQMDDGNPDEEMVQLKSTRTFPGNQSDGD